MILLLTFCFVFAAKAQEVAVHATPVAKAGIPFIPLQVGDKLPEEVWDISLQVVQHPEGKETLLLKDYREKLLILDFWATWCTSCIAGFPKLNALQLNNKENLKVLLVSTKTARDTHAKVEQFLEKRKAAYQFTSVTEDTVLDALFPHKSVPFYVWIYKDQVIALTGAKDINQENINQALRGEKVYNSASMLVPYDSNRPLFENGNGGEAPELIVKTLLTKYAENLNYSISWMPDENGMYSSITFVNCPLFALYRHAYPEITSVSRGRLLFSVQDPHAFVLNDTSRTWDRKNSYCYEAHFPKSTKAEALKRMRDELQKVFGYTVTAKEQALESWVLTLSNREKLPKFSKELKSETNINEHSGQAIFYNNRSLGYLLIVLEKLYKVPFLDETGLKDHVMLRLPADLRNLEELQKSLASQGLSLSPQTRTVPTVTISDN